MYLAWSRELARLGSGVVKGVIPASGLTVLALFCITWTGIYETLRVLHHEPPNWLSDPASVIGIAVTFFWIVNATVVWCFSNRERPALSGYAFVMTFVVAIKYVFFDTLAGAMTGQWDEVRGMCTNRLFVAGVMLIGMSALACRRFKRSADAGESRLFRRANVIALSVLTALLITWTPTYELARAFRFDAIRSAFANPTFAMHVAISVFWSLNAVGLVIVGMHYQRAELRYVGIGLFGLTVAKVLRFDLWHIATIYRILSCLVLGVLLLFASLQYQRRAMRADST